MMHNKDYLEYLGKEISVSVYYYEKCLKEESNASALAYILRSLNSHVNIREQFLIMSQGEGNISLRFIRELIKAYQDGDMHEYQKKYSIQFWENYIKGMNKSV